MYTLVVVVVVVFFLVSSEQSEGQPMPCHAMDTQHSWHGMDTQLTLKKSACHKVNLSGYDVNR